MARRNATRPGQTHGRDTDVIRTSVEISKPMILLGNFSHSTEMHEPYRGAGPALIDLLGGQVQVMFATTPTSIEYFRSGKLRALAVSTTTRLEVLPDIPTVSEYLPGYEASGWFGVGAPKNMPAETVDKLNTEINAALADPKMKARFADLGGMVLPGSPADFGRHIVNETEKWAMVIRAANIKPT
jgi:tripartite-type tricarboxylate transporter receptor subunit TctC